MATATTPAQPTHRIRPKAGNAEWEHVTDEELATIKKQAGAYSFRSGYEVEALAEKSPKLATNKPGPADAAPDGTNKEAAK